MSHTTRLTVVELQQDVAYLAKRAQRAGSFSCGERRRDWGASSNYIVAIAYGVDARPEMPFDRSDYAACVRAVRGLPRHRRTETVMAALRAARQAWQENEARFGWIKTKEPA